jgi:hypothetical protein
MHIAGGLRPCVTLLYATMCRNVSYEGECVAKVRACRWSASWASASPDEVFTALTPCRTRRLSHAGCGEQWWRTAEALASSRRFCAVAVSSTSSLTPLKPRSRSRSSFRMRFMCANLISIFLHSRRDCWKASVLARALGREARRPAGPAGYQSRIDHQPEDRQDARPHPSTFAAWPGRRGDRVILANVWSWRHKRDLWECPLFRRL